VGIQVDWHSPVFVHGLDTVRKNLTVDIQKLLVDFAGCYGIVIKSIDNNRSNVAFGFDDAVKAASSLTESSWISTLGYFSVKPFIISASRGDIESDPVQRVNSLIFTFSPAAGEFELEADAVAGAPDVCGFVVPQPVRASDAASTPASIALMSFDLFIIIPLS
jgi:hypothetical protein